MPLASTELSDFLLALHQSVERQSFQKCSKYPMGMPALFENLSSLKTLAAQYLSRYLRWKSLNLATSAMM
jgi:hypothetical protein